MNCLEETKDQAGKVGEQKKLNIFKDDLAYSEEASEEEFWQKIYKKAFPNMVGNIHCKGKNQGQKLGIDRIIQLSSGETLKIDEKKRRKNWDDFALEYKHVYDNGNKTLGWANKDLQINYLAYAFMPAKKVYLFAWEMLRLAWLKYREEWYELAKLEKDNGYEIIESLNKGYKTYSVGVPIDVLLKVITEVSLIQI